MDIYVVPEIQLGFKGQRRITTNREALEKMRSYAWAIPFVNPYPQTPRP
jgi:hypothetical protein